MRRSPASPIPAALLALGFFAGCGPKVTPTVGPTGPSTRGDAEQPLLTAEPPADPTPGQPPIADPVPVLAIAPERGFIDSPLAFDGAGGRLAYVHADAGNLADLVVVDLASKAEVVRFALPAALRVPVAIGFVEGGERFLVVAPAGETTVRAAILDRAGAQVRGYGPATAITPITYDERPALSLYTRTEKLKGKDAGLRHVVEVFDLETGKRLGARRELATDFDLRVARLELKINHWLDGYTIAVGMLAGEYDKVEDQRAPDAEAWYDVPRGVIAKRIVIGDVLAHLKQRALLAKHSGERAFLQVSDDRKRLERVDGGVVTAIALAEPIQHYDPTSLVYQARGDTLYAALTIDPVHPDAAAARRAVPVFIDLYEVESGATEAARRARVRPPEGGAGVRWLAGDGHWAVVPRHVGFERGGPELRVYRLE